MYPESVIDDLEVLFIKLFNVTDFSLITFSLFLQISHRLCGHFEEVTFSPK